MGTNSLTTRSTGETITSDFFNDQKTALSGDFVGRNSSGVPTASQNLGTVALPWGTVRADSLVVDGTAIDSSLTAVPQNVVLSGKTRTTSNQPQFITPNGAALTAIISATTTNLAFDVNGTTVTAVADITITGLTAAASSNNTCLVDDTAASGQADTRLWGEPEHRKTITVDTMGSSITPLVGTWQAFKISTEYFFAYVASTTQLTKCKRGYFYDSALAPKNRVVFSNNDTITLMKLGWVFLQSNGTTANVTYTNPTWSITAPAAPVTGDYWYDLANETWKRYDGATFQIIDRTLIGYVVQDSTNCVAARCIDFFKAYKPDNTFEVEVSTTEIIKTSKPFARVIVAGNAIQMGPYLASWNITTQLATSADMYNASEQASTLYYLYVKDTGELVMSDISPYYRHDLLGLYHPHNPWRSVGSAYNSSGSALVNAGDYVSGNDEAMGYGANNYGSSSTKIWKFATQRQNRGTAMIGQMSDATLGAEFVATRPGNYCFALCAGYDATDGNLGISKNSGQLTTSVSAITVADIDALGYQATSGGTEGISVQTPLLIGDTMRPHATGSSSTGANSLWRYSRSPSSMSGL